MIDRLRKISYFLAYAVATIPLWHYIRGGRILVFMVAVMLFAYIMVILSSVQASKANLNSEKRKVAFPRWLPNKPKYQKWWSLSRHTHKWHLLLVLPKMGLALGFMEWSVISGFPTRTYIFHELYYVYGYSSERLPQLVPVFIALFLIKTFSVIECNLISSFIFLGHQIQSTKKKTVFILTSRLLLVFSFLGLVFLTRVESGVYQQHRVHVCRSYRLYIQRGETNSDNPYELSCYSRRIKETLYLVFITPLDQGVLLSSNIMRPSKQVIYSPWNWSENQLFVARQVVAGLLGLLLYAGATWVILWFVEDEPDHRLN